MRIPEYFYNQDKTTDKSNYYNFIRKKIDIDSKSNPIHDQIFNIFPSHIITTNYDCLLEKSNSANTKMYSVVAKDEEILSKTNNKYIIKMHGDFNDICSIILKESDYINYEQNRPLISTYIRSLLIDHTFLFVGYSLNDINLNLIIGWINYFVNVYGIKDRPESFLVESNSVSVFEVERLRNKNIRVVSLDDLPKELVSKDIPENLSMEAGIKLYSYLKCIAEEKILKKYIRFDKLLSISYSLLDSYNYISHQDLMQVCYLGRTDFISKSLIFYNTNDFESFSKALKSKEYNILPIIKKSGIESIQFANEKHITVNNDVHLRNNIEDLYINNKYSELLDYVNKNGDYTTKLYYSVILCKSELNLLDLIREEEIRVKDSDFISILLHKMRSRLATISLFDRQEEKTRELRQLFDTIPIKYQNATNFLKNLFYSQNENLFKMQKILSKQEDRYKNENTTYKLGYSLQYVLELQAYAYDYYYYIQKNAIPINNFADPKKYFEFYIKAILCTYFPDVSNKPDIVFGLENTKEKYIINEIDLDIIVKFSSCKDLKKWSEKYNVSNLKIDTEINLIIKYENLCKSLKTFNNKYMLEYLCTFTFLLSLAEKEKYIIENTFKSLVLTFNYYIENKVEFAELLAPSVLLFLKSINTEKNTEIISKLVETLYKENIFKKDNTIIKSNFQKILKIIGSNYSKKVKSIISKGIESIGNSEERINEIYYFRHNITMEKQIDFLKDNISRIDIHMLYYFLIEGHIEFNKEIEDIFIGKIQKEHIKRTASPNLIAYPNNLVFLIDASLIMSLVGIDFNISRLKPYVEHSDHIAFIIDPKNFDYSKVDTNNYMWINLIKSKKYQHFFSKNKEKIMTDKLKKAIEFGAANRNQQKVVYGILLSKDEIWEY